MSNLFKILKALKIDIIDFLELPYYWSDGMKLTFIMLNRALKKAKNK